ncbi:MAG: hypothetical protein PUB22_10170 [Clostridiales bacterium]|nr:hypothetical protein [Clostridiales bacterium]
MKKIWKRLLVLCGVFIAAAAAFAVYLHFSDEPEETIQYETWGNHTLPILSGMAEGRTINFLQGFVDQTDYTVTEGTVMPMENDGSLDLNVQLYGNTLKEISWRLESRSGEKVLAEGRISQWNTENDQASFTLELGETLAADTDGQLVLSLVLENGKEADYYTRVRRSEDFHLSELMEFVMDLHEAAFDETKAETYVSKWETNSTADHNTLADVNIHSALEQLSWGDLSPQILGEPSIRILELDGTFGSFRVDYEMTAAGEGKEERFLVSEYFSVQWTSARIYLMNYHRTALELFAPTEEMLKSGNLEFGILSPEDLQIRQSEEGGNIAFSVGGELWEYQKSAKKIRRIFSGCGEGIEGCLDYDSYDLKTLQVEENGDVCFLVYGYMNRGNHEGRVGVSCLRYEAEENALTELFFLPYTGSFAVLKQGLDTLASMGSNNQVYIMLGDEVYSIDWQGGEMMTLVNQVQNRNLVVNNSQTAIAWELDDPQEEARRVQILYLDTGENQIVEASEGDWISPRGFIDEDCILGFGHSGDEAVVGAERVFPCYAVLIQSRSGAAVVRYEYENVYISSVAVLDGQVELSRMQKTSSGAFVSISNDTLIQNVSSEEDISSSLESKMTERKKRIWYLPMNKAETKEFRIEGNAPDMVSYTLSEAFPLAAVLSEDSQERYYAYGEGRLKAVTTTAGEAIREVFDSMGTVIDSRGRLIWYRTGRKSLVSCSIGEMEGCASSESLRQCLKLILQEAEEDTSVLNGLEEMSAMEVLEEAMPGSVVNLTGSPLKALLYFVNQGHSVLLLDEDQTAILLSGFDAYNVEYYDPVNGTSYKQGQQDAEKFLASRKFSYLSYVVE